MYQCDNTTMLMQLQPVQVSKAAVRKARAAARTMLSNELGALVLVLGILLLIAYRGAGLTT